jgi:hypothetical protein
MPEFLDEIHSRELINRPLRPKLFDISKRFRLTPVKTVQLAKSKTAASGENILVRNYLNTGLLLERLLLMMVR